MSTAQYDDRKLILSNDNRDLSLDIFQRAVRMGTDFKLQETVRQKQIDEEVIDSLLESMPIEGMGASDLLTEFEEKVLPYCYNFSSPNFMGFPDAGNSVAAISGSIVSDFLQQNLINQSFCSPSGTFVEVAVIRWLRESLGYKNIPYKNVFDAGGIITGGGTTSNAVGMLLARENFKPGTMQNGVNINDNYYVVVPKGIGHYSVKAAQMWAGCGNNLIEVETIDFRYDLDDLKKKIEEYKGKIMAVVAYAGDTRSMTVDNFEAVADIVHDSGQNIWLHADACHGFSLGFSDDLKYKLKGIERFDSITTDPQKVMSSPYTISALLVKDPKSLKTVSTLSDLIMQEQYAFGQVTPFIGSKPWMSLKLWFAMKNIGKNGFGELVKMRHDLAKEFAEMIRADEDFILLNEVDINSVMFFYKGRREILDVDELNIVNKRIHELLLEEGKYHLHQFGVPDAGVIDKGKILYPQRFMPGNPNTKSEHLVAMLEYVRSLGNRVDKEEV